MHCLFLKSVMYAIGAKKDLQYLLEYLFVVKHLVLWAKLQNSWPLTRFLLNNKIAHCVKPCSSTVPLN